VKPAAAAGAPGAGTDQAAPRRGRTVVVAIGNALRGDDGVGLLVASALRTRVAPDVKLVERDGESLGLIDAWDGADTVLLIDAVRTGGAAGTISRREVGREGLPTSARTTSSHALGLAETVEIARALGRLPRRVVVWGVEVRALAAGGEPSPEVVAAVPAVVDGVLRDLEASTEKGDEPCTSA
jgi:hydrogenase maturation protease